jgi:hypothetical protein
VIQVAALYVAVAVCIDDLVAIHKYQVRRLRLLDALRQGVLLLVESQWLALLALGSLAPTHWRSDNVFKTARVWSRLRAVD